MNLTASGATTTPGAVSQAVDPSVFSSICIQLRFAQYFQVAIVTFLLHDALSTLGKEVKYFWSAPRKFNRYIGIFSAVVYLWHNTYHVSKAPCQFTLYTAVACNWININVIDYMLVMRVLALFSNARTMKIFLHVFFLIEAVAMFGVLVYVQVYCGATTLEFGMGYTACQSVRTAQPVFFILAWSIPLLSQGLTGFHLVRVLVVDQAVYFAAAIFCNVGMIISTTTANPHFFSKRIMGSPSLLVILGARLLVHLKEAGEKGFTGGMSYRVRKALSGIKFAENAGRLGDAA
ncbi:hypothetical protein AB1N83_011253 [Pleurotus pulmonarius]